MLTQATANNGVMVPVERVDRTDLSEEETFEIS